MNENINMYKESEKNIVNTLTLNSDEQEKKIYNNNAKKNQKKEKKKHLY